jgi:hypothetical protein
MTLADVVRSEARAQLAHGRLPLRYRVLYGITYASPVLGMLVWLVHDEIDVRAHRLLWALGPLGRQIAGAVAVFIVATAWLRGCR